MTRSRRALENNPRAGTGNPGVGTLVFENHQSGNLAHVLPADFKETLYAEGC